MKNWPDAAFAAYVAAMIGSEGYCALKFGRKFVGIELKKEPYFRQACEYLDGINAQKDWIAA